VGEGQKGVWYVVMGSGEKNNEALLSIHLTDENIECKTKKSLSGGADF
jgi:hypothetical protein